MYEIIAAIGTSTPTGTIGMTTTGDVIGGAMEGGMIGAAAIGHIVRVEAGDTGSRTGRLATVRRVKAECKGQVELQVTSSRRASESRSDQGA